MSRINTIPLLRREYLGFTGVLGRLNCDSPREMPIWCETSSLNTELMVTIASKVSALKTLVEKNENYPTLKGSTGRSPVHLICSVNSPGQLEALRVLCSANKAAVNVPDGMHRTPLHHALSHHNLVYHTEMNTGINLVLLIKELINLGGNVNALDDDQISPLHLAMHAGRLMELPTILKMFIDAGADVSLLVPARSRMYGMLEYIGEDADEEDLTLYPDHTTVLHLACRMIGPLSIKAMMVLLSPKNVEFRDSYRRTPLHDLIISIGQTPLEPYSDRENAQEKKIFLSKIKMFFDLGANFNATDMVKATPLCMALQKYRFPICSTVIKALLGNGALANVKYFKEITPMHLLFRYFNRSIRDLLPDFLLAEGRINAKDRRQQTPLFYALKNGGCDIETLEYLCSKGADVMATDREDLNCLHVFCGEKYPNKSVEVAKWLVKKGCCVNGKTLDGDTPLFLYLMSEGEPEFLETLISLGADVTVRNNNRSNALHIVLQSSIRWRSCSDYQIVDMLIKRGADVNAKDFVNSTPLLYGIRGTANEKAVRLLLVAGADPNHWDGEVPLHIAASEGNPSLTKLLLAFGADVNLSDYMGLTPLHRATESTKGNGNRTLMALIDGGADPSVVDYNGRTPLMSMTFKTCKLFIPYIAILMATGRYSMNEEEDHFFSCALCHSFTVLLNNCIEKASLLNDIFIGNARTTMAEFLLQPAERARRMVGSPEIQDNLRSVLRSFDNFSIFIKEKWDLMDHLNDLEYKTISSLNLFHSGQLPLLVSEHILSFLTYPDMISLSEIMV